MLDLRDRRVNDNDELPENAGDNSLGEFSNFEATEDSEKRFVYVGFGELFLNGTDNDAFGWHSLFYISIPGM